jgi:hypothetical protein
MPDRRQPPRPTYDELVAVVTAQAERIAELEAIELVVLELRAAFLVSAVWLGAVVACGMTARMTT